MIHYTEIVTEDMDDHCATLAQVHGLTFGATQADLGEARVAQTPDGNLIGVRKPLAQHETPIVRTYIAVADIAAAVKNAEETGAMIAYPPTKQGDTGTWAIYVKGGLQFGLWQP